MYIINSHHFHDHVHVPFHVHVRVQDRVHVHVQIHGHICIHLHVQYCTVHTEFCLGRDTAKNLNTICRRKV
jgi:hypothetical protein